MASFFLTLQLLALSADAVVLHTQRILQNAEVNGDDIKLGLSDCETAALWVQRTGLSKRPEWYPGLSSDSTKEDVKAFLGRHKLFNCKEEVSSECSSKALWAKQMGLKKNPSWYPGLDEQSSVNEIKAHFATCNVWGCRQDALDSCEAQARWSIEFGIKESPSSYVGLTESSSLEDFKALFAKRKMYGCHTAEEMDCCERTAQWAKSKGVSVHPQFYPSLTKESSVADFKDFFAKLGRHGCEATDATQEPSTDGSSSAEARMLAAVSAARVKLAAVHHASSSAADKAGVKLKWGILAPLTAEGWLKVARAENEEDMTIYIQRLVKAGGHDSNAFQRCAGLVGSAFGTFDALLTKLASKLGVGKLALTDACEGEEPEFPKFGKQNWMDEEEFCLTFDCGQKEDMMSKSILQYRVDPECPMRTQYWLVHKTDECVDWSDTDTWKRLAYPYAYRGKSWTSWTHYCEELEGSHRSCDTAAYETRQSPDCPGQVQYRAFSEAGWLQ